MKLHFPSRSCLSNFLIFALLPLGICFSGCTFDGIWNPPGRDPGAGGPAPKSEPLIPAPIAPWEVWDAAAAGDPVFFDADRLLARGDLQGALRDYQEIESHAISNEIHWRAYLRRLSTMLKLGRSRAVLDEVSKRLKQQGKSVEESDPVLALYTAYSYLHLGDSAQAVVWFSLARKQVHETGIIARRAVSDATRVLMSVTQETLNRLEAGLTNDAFLQALIKEEQIRRAQGGRVEANPAMAWFNPASYSPEGPSRSLVKDGDVKDSASPGDGDKIISLGDSISLGVLLPLSGKYAGHSNLVRQGIELAVSESPYRDKIRLVYADTKGEPLVAGSEFDRLVQQEAVSLVLGPMLVKTAEEVAQHSDAAGVPFITFTKRPGITDLSRVGFRLGATADNQCTELANYVVSHLKKRNLAIIAPKEAGGDDFPSCFRSAVVRAGGSIVQEAMYVPGNTAAIKTAVDSLGNDASSIEGIFIPDTLEHSAPVLDALRNSPFRQALVLGPAYWNESVAVRGYAPLLENAVIVTPFFAQSQRPQVERFLQSYRAKYNRLPDVLTAQSYDATQLVLSALAQMPEGTPVEERSGALAKAMRELRPQNAVTGLLTVEANGEITRQMSVLRLRGGEMAEVMAAGQVRDFVIPADTQRTILTEPRNLPMGATPIPASIAKDRPVIQAQ